MKNDAANVDLLAASLKRLGEFGAKSLGSGEELTRVYGRNLKQFGKDVKFIQGQGGLAKAGNLAHAESLAGLSGFDWSVSQSIERTKALDAALAQLVQSGNATRANEAFNTLAAAAARNHVSIDQLRGLLPGYQAATPPSSRPPVPARWPAA